jgi:hypothetical protein
MMSEADATAMSEDMVDATVSLKLRSCSRMPPARKQQPRTWKEESEGGVSGSGDGTHKQDVGEDAAQHAGLDDSYFALLQRNDGDLESVSKRNGAH